MSAFVQFVPMHGYSVLVGALFAPQIAYFFSHDLDHVAACVGGVGALA
jgi:hypothetical protein